MPWTFCLSEPVEAAHGYSREVYSRSAVYRGTQSQARVSCGNAGAVESVESQRQASHSFHEPLGNLAKSRRDSHISTAPATRADGKVENQKQVSHFPPAPSFSFRKKKHRRDARASP